MKPQVTTKAAVAACLFGAALSASAATTIFSAGLGAAGEPVPTSFATGAAIVSFDDVADSVTVQLSFQGVANNAPFGHIHLANPGSSSGPVALGFTALPADTSGTYSNLFSLTPAAFDSLLAGALQGRAYVNIHTPGTYGGGEIRGFLQVSVVPEPGTYALMLAGLVAVVGVARRQRAG